MDISTIAPVQKASISQFADITPQQAVLTSLDDRVSEAFSTMSSVTATEYRAIMNSVTDATSAVSPTELFELQVRLADYSLKLETIATLTHKGVSGIEALLKT